MLILGIETSCDETAASVVRDGKTILSQVVASSSDLHTKSGGIIPENAARKQVEYIVPVVDQALLEAKLKLQELDALAVTVGPGLIGSLLVGIEFAKTLSLVFEKPIVPVNHLVGHLYANWLNGTVPTFPAVGMVVSGGHTDLVFIKNHKKIQWIGGTRDDAAGEAFDKAARLMGLPYPGGPAISQEAEKVISQTQFSLPRPMLKEKTLDLSFSGLKTAVRNTVQSLSPKEKNNPQTISLLAFEFQEAVTDCLVKKLSLAVNRYQPKSILLAGGVIANKRLREKLKKAFPDNSPYRLFIPEVKLCTDNASYIAACAFYHNKNKNPLDLQAIPDLDISTLL